MRKQVDPTTQLQKRLDGPMETDDPIRLHRLQNLKRESTADAFGGDGYSGRMQRMQEASQVQLVEHGETAWSALTAMLGIYAC